MSTIKEKVLIVPATSEEGYTQVKDLIYHQVHKFKRQYGGDFDELVGEANLAFVQGHASVATGRANSGRKYKDEYHTEIRRWVWFEMFESMRKRLSRNSKAAMVPMSEDHEYEAPQDDFDAVDMVAGLPDDARHVLGLVLGRHEGVEAVAMAKGGEGRNYRSTIRQHLAEEGWKNTRINEAFATINGALV